MRGTALGRLIAAVVVTLLAVALQRVVHAGSVPAFDFLLATLLVLGSFLSWSELLAAALLGFWTLNAQSAGSPELLFGIAIPIAMRALAYVFRGSLRLTVLAAIILGIFCFYLVVDYRILSFSVIVWTILPDIAVSAIFGMLVFELFNSLYTPVGARRPKNVLRRA
jgi:hypothetical protein